MRAERRLSFTVPAGAGTYAPEVLYANVDNDVRTGMDLVQQYQLLVEALPATAVVETDILVAGGDANTAANWIALTTTLNAVGLAALVQMAWWRGVRWRVKSGGTAGTATVSASWGALRS